MSNSKACEMFRRSIGLTWVIHKDIQVTGLEPNQIRSWHCLIHVSLNLNTNVCNSILDVILNITGNGKIFYFSHHSALWVQGDYGGHPTCLCERFSQQDVSIHESYSPDQQAHTATSGNSGTICFLRQTNNLPRHHYLTGYLQDAPS